MTRRLAVILVCFALTREGAYGFGSGVLCSAPEVVTDAKFVPGQIWAYRTNAGEEGATVTILRVETFGKVGTIVHVRLDGIHFRNCQGETVSDTLPHAPFARSALDSSVTRLVGQVADLPAYEDGYQDWLRHCGGVYSISVARVVALDEAQYSTALGCR